MEIRHTTPLSLGVLLALALSATGAAGQQVYKWTDEDGNVHFGNSVPPEYADQVFPNRMPQVDPEAEAAREQAQADAVLLRTYLSVQEIEDLRDERLERLEYDDRLTLKYLENLQRQLADLEADAAVGVSDPAALGAEIDATRRKIAAYEAKLADSAAKQAEIRAKFERDIERFQQLTAANANPDR
jgi:hypothetical protein